MSYAVQCIEENIISVGGYVSEIEMINRFKINQDYVFIAFFELMRDGFLSKEFYQNKGHKVLGRFIERINGFEINPEVEMSSYDCSYLLIFENIIYCEGKKYIIPDLKQIFVGDYKGALTQAREIKKILANDKNSPNVIFKIKRLEKMKK